MSKQSDYTKPKSFTRHCIFTLPEDTAALLKYVAAWEKQTMTQMIRRHIDDFLSQWRQENPGKYEVWRQHHENSRD